MEAKHNVATYVATSQLYKLGRRWTEYCEIWLERV